MMSQELKFTEKINDLTLKFKTYKRYGSRYINVTIVELSKSFQNICNAAIKGQNQDLDAEIFITKLAEYANGTLNNSLVFVFEVFATNIKITLNVKNPLDGTITNKYFFSIYEVTNTEKQFKQRVKYVNKHITATNNELSNKTNEILELQSLVKKQGEEINKLYGLISSLCEAKLTLN